MRLYILTGKSRNLKLLYNEAVNNSIYNSVGLYVCIYFNLIVTNKNEITPKLNDCSRFYFKILYFLRQQYLLSLFFCNVYFFFPINGGIYFHLNLSYLGWSAFQNGPGMLWFYHWKFFVPGNTLVPGKEKWLMTLAITVMFWPME